MRPAPFLALLILACTLGQTGSVKARPPAAAEATERRVEEILARMSLEEKIGQLNLATNSQSFSIEDVVAGRVGGVVGFKSPHDIARVQSAAGRSRLGIPLLVGGDIVHGVRTMFPIPLGLASSFNPDLARVTARMAARDASSMGANWSFAPMVDIARDARWGRMVEGSGEDVFLTEALARAQVEGFHQGGLATTLKHFAGYGAALGGRDYDSAEIAPGQLYDHYLPPFLAGIEAGSESVMSAFHVLNGRPSTANGVLLTDILRKRWGYDGFVVSDWTAIPELVNHGVAADPAEAARKALLAGVDMDMAGGLYSRHLADEVRAGRVPEASVTEAARRVVRAKVRVGLFERPPFIPTADGPAEPDEEARALARQAARQTIVLLRNDGTLPLSTGRRIAVVGGIADEGGDLIGPHGALFRASDTVSVREGLRRRAAAAGASVSFTLGCDADCRSPDGFAAAIDAARQADTVVAVMGESIEMTGESGSRAHLGLPGRQPELLQRLVETGTPVVLIIVAGRPIELGPVLDRLGAVLMAWYPGTEGGNALADLLVGDEDFSAKLPVTWPRTIGQIPLNYDRLSVGRPADAADRFTLRYVDEPLSPLFPFGFGLAYTTFAVSDLIVTTPRLSRDGTLEIRVRLINTGLRPGQEVVQLYIRQKVASVSRPVRQLKAFEKVALKAGEARSLTFRVAASDLGYHKDEGTYVVEPGPFEVFVGSSSDATLAGTFEIVE